MRTGALKSTCPGICPSKGLCSIPALPMTRWAILPLCMEISESVYGGAVISKQREVEKCGEMNFWGRKSAGLSLTGASIPCLTLPQCILGA